MVKQNATAVYIWIQLCLFLFTASLENFRPVMEETLLFHAIDFRSQSLSVSESESEREDQELGNEVSVQNAVLM